LTTLASACLGETSQISLTYRNKFKKLVHHCVKISKKEKTETVNMHFIVITVKTLHRIINSNGRKKKVWNEIL